jgi:hypothetical protein
MAAEIVVAWRTAPASGAEAELELLSEAGVREEQTGIEHDVHGEPREERDAGKHRRLAA